MFQPSLLLPLRRVGLFPLLACALVVAAAAPGAEPERLAVFMLDLEQGEGQPQLVVAEPIPGHSYCGSPSWSPDEKQIVLDATPGKQWNKTHILVTEAATKRDRKFIDLGPGNCPTWSPDGKQIAFLLNGGAVADAQPGIWIMNADGTGRRRLGSGGLPKWSPNGKHLLLVSFSNPCELSLLDPTDGGEQVVTVAKHAIYSVPSWAGDDQTIVAIVREAGPLQVALLDIAKPAEARISQVLFERGRGLAEEPIYPVYSVAAKRLVFVGRGPKGQSLYELDLAKAGPPRLLEKDPLHPKIASLSLSADGRYLLFCSSRELKP